MALELHIPEGQQLCSGPCGRILPATLENFPRNTERNCGVDRMCDECWFAKKRHLLSCNRDQMLAKFKEAGLKLIQGELQGTGDVPHSAHLVQALYDCCGGVRGYATMLMDQYVNSKEGSYGRTRILELIARLTVSNAAQGGAKKPVELMSDDELAERRKELILQALGGERLKLELLAETTNAD